MTASAPRTPPSADVTEAIEFRHALDAEPAGNVAEPLARLLIQRWRRRKAEESDGNHNGHKED